MTGAQLFVNELRRRGVEFVSTLCGHGLNPFFSACLESGIKLVDTRNEQAAAYLAEAYGRLSRRVGVCAVSSGVAHANAMTGVVNAYLDGAPMMLVTGCGAVSTMGLGHFQDLDQVALAAHVCKWARLVEVPERIPQMVEEAFAAATTGRPGPVHMTFPLDVQMAVVDSAKALSTLRTTAEVSQSSWGDPGLINDAAQWIAEAQRPVLVAGSGVFYAGGERALADLVETNGIPFVVPIWDRGSVPERRKEFMGVLGAATGGPTLLPDADLVILAGVHFDYRLGYLQPPTVREDARVIRIEVDPKELQRGIKTHLTLQGDPRSVMTQIQEACLRRAIPPHSEWLHQAQARRQEFQNRCLEARERAPKGLHALDIVRAIQTVLTEDTVLIIDGGNIGQWAHQFLCDRYPGHWLTCGASGVVGYGLPAALAARLLYPQRPVILLSGDGAFTFTVAELESAARQGLNFVAVVADDAAWGIVVGEHRREYGHTMACELGPVRFDLVAEGFGCHGVRISQPHEIVPALREALAREQPTVIHVPIVRSSPAD